MAHVLTESDGPHWAEAGARVIRRSQQWCQSWALWRVPKPVLVLVLIVNSLTVVVTAATAFLVPIDSGDLARFGMLTGCTWAAVELTRHFERRRSFAHQAYVAHIDTTAVWVFAAVIVLPPALASAMVVITRILWWYRVKKRRAVPYRQIYSGATVLLGAQVAILVLAAGMRTYPGIPSDTFPAGMVDLGVVVLAGTLSWAVNFALVLAALALFNPTVRASDLTNNFSEQLLEAGAAALGLLVAVAVVANPVALPGVIVVMVALNRGLLVSQYEHAARIDAKTGLATAGRWHEFAKEMLARARHQQTNLGLLIVDLDHFKAINDTYGHPFGDKALRCVADELRSEVRELDACGRWGGEEFTVLLADVANEQNVHRVAERIRLRIQSVVLDPPDESHDSVTIRASVGGVFFIPDETTTLDDLVLAADSELYAAKNAGRNTVRLVTAGGGQPVADDRSGTGATADETQDTDRRRDTE